MVEPLIDAARVVEVFEDCGSEPGPDAIHVEGIAVADFRQDRLDAHREEIAGMLDGLPVEFRRSVGGGWSFLNGCVDREGQQWTGLQGVVEQLFLLGQAIGRVTPVLPREMWATLPGGVPYYAIEDAEAAT